MAVLEIWPTQTGRELALAFVAGEPLGVSLRGWACRGDDGHAAVPRSPAMLELQLVAFDVVRTPAIEAPRLRLHHGP